MNLRELADLLGTNIAITYYANQDNRCCCSLKGVEIVLDGFLVAAWENGTNAEAAIVNYSERISNTKIKFKDSYLNVPTLTI